MTVNYACGTLENSVILKLVLICLINNMEIKVIKRHYTSIQWNFLKKKLISSLWVLKTTTFIKLMHINPNSMLWQQVNNKTLDNFQAIVLQ